MAKAAVKMGTVTLAIDGQKRTVAVPEEIWRTVLYGDIPRDIFEWLHERGITLPSKGTVKRTLTFHEASGVRTSVGYCRRMGRS